MKCLTSLMTQKYQITSHEDDIWDWKNSFIKVSNCKYQV